jgi:hypothetical protein
MSNLTNDKISFKAKDVVNEKLTHGKNNKAMKETGAMKALDALMGKGVIINLDIQEDYMVRPNRQMLETIAEGLLMAAEAQANNVDGLTVESIADYLEWVFANRINYVRGHRNRVQPKSVEYPVMVYDALARIARYDGGKTDGAHYIPSLCTQDNPYVIAQETRQRLWPDADAPGGVRRNAPVSWLDDGNRVIEYPGLARFTALLKRAGIQMAMALPMHRELEIRKLFEMEVTGDRVTTACNCGNVQEVLARACYCMEPATNLVGTQKVELCRVQDVIGMIYELSYDYVVGRNER